MSSEEMCLLGMWIIICFLESRGNYYVISFIVVAAQLNRNDVQQASEG